MNAAESYSLVQKQLAHPIVLSAPKHDRVYRRFMGLLHALKEWKVVCQRCDEDHAIYNDAHKRLTEILTLAEENKPYDQAEQDRVGEIYIVALPRIRLDIHCIYIFAKITFINYAALLYEMAGEPSHDWKQLGRFKNRISRPDGLPLLQEFAKTFGHHIRWFDAQVNLYRNDFIEHPVQANIGQGYIADADSVRLTGQIGTTLNNKDAELLKNIAIDLIPSFPELNTVHEQWSLYHWVCRNLENVPKDKRPAAEHMIRRVGLDSGDIGEIARKANQMFADFLAFFNEWYDSIKPAKQATEPSQT